ncbi:tannase-domain-containing protein [Lizonia empirigonia]|nr:tannase-domain-containing protein [Lizonia empirigonia]
MGNLSTRAAVACNSSAIPLPVLFGADILNLSANLVQNFSQNVYYQLYFNHPSITVRNVEFCITVTYTHPGHNDAINVEIWLPTKTCNGRLQAIGGGDIGMAGAIGEGYVATTSDAGIDLIKKFYGRPGGRQGFMLAQRYPTAYDGIAAAAPALNLAHFIPAAAWAQVMMSLSGQYPPKCKLDALTDAAFAHCDPLDGMTFDPFTLVGKTARCPSTNTTITISNAAATVANLTWTGPRKANGDFLCTNGTCTGLPIGLGEAWLKFFLKDAEWDYTQIQSVEEYAHLLHASVQEYDSIIGPRNPDLRAFQATGSKILTHHGLVSRRPYPAPRHTLEAYYTRVQTTSPNTASFFRFPVPGLAHCSGGRRHRPSRRASPGREWRLPLSCTDPSAFCVRTRRRRCGGGARGRVRVRSVRAL